MEKNERNMLFCIMLGLSSILNGQDKWEQIKAFPTAAELGNFGRTPIGLFSGTNQVSIPIFEFKTKNLNYPVTLNYASNGLKVDKVSSRVGFDWSMPAEGVITRIIRGYPDDANQVVPYPVDLDPIEYSSLTQTEIDAEIAFYMDWSLGTETQPDMFAFNFNGYSGIFYTHTDTNYNEKIVLVPYQDLKIIPDLANDNFLIIDPGGVQYKFGKGERASFNNGGSMITTSAYYLTRIVHPAGDTITLNYNSSTESPAYKTSISDQLFYGHYLGSDCPDPLCSQTDFYSDNIPLANTCQIWGFSSNVSSIVSTEYGRINFYYQDDRLDFMEPRLDSIVVLNEENEVVRSVSLYQRYAHATLFDNRSDYTNVGSSRDDVTYRMFLDSVIIRDNQGDKSLKYSFEYNNLNDLPVRLSYSQDHWGYFNGKSNSSLLPDEIPSNIKSSYFSGIAGSRMSADRNPDYLYAQKGLLSKVNYPTGGYTTYEYEAHSFGDPTVAHGGVRLRKQSSYTNDNQVAFINSYSYSDGSASLYNIQYYYYKVLNKGCTCQIPSVGNFLTYNYYHLGSSPLYPTELTGNAEIGYQNVTVYNGDSATNAGKTEYEFEIGHDRFESLIFTDYSAGASVYPRPYSNSGWKSGTKLSETIYKNTSGNYIPVRQIIYQYHEDTENSVSNYYPVIQNDDYIYAGSDLETMDVGTHFDVTFYEVISRWRYLSSEIQNTFSLEGQLLITDTIKYYYDNPDHVQLSREERKNSKGDTELNIIRYPLDYIDNNSFDVLNSQHIINLPVDNRKYVDSMLIKGEQTRYNDYGQPIKLYEAETNGTDVLFDIDNPYTFTLRDSVNYDIRHNLSQVIKIDNLTTSYIWGYNNTLPVAKAINAPVYRIAYSSFDAYNEGSWNYSSGTLVSSTNSKSGVHYYSFSGTNAITRSITPGTYILEYWANSSITTSGGTITSISNSFPDDNGWIHFKKKVVITSNTTLSLGTSAVTKIDELRLYPFMAQMYTYSYIPLVGMSSSTDMNGNTTYYEYDPSGRLEFIKDNNRKIIKHIKYHLRSENAE